MLRGGYTEGDWKKIAALSPLMGGLTRKEEIVGLIRYLLSDTARYVTGQFSSCDLRRKHCLNEHECTARSPKQPGRGGPLDLCNRAIEVFFLGLVENIKSRPDPRDDHAHDFVKSHSNPGSYLTNIDVNVNLF